MIRRILLALFLLPVPGTVISSDMSFLSRSMLTDYLQTEAQLPFMSSCQDRLAHTEEDCRHLRDELVASGYFPADYGKNGGTFYFGPLNFAEQRDIPGCCMSVLRMIEWLDARGKQDDNGKYAYALLEKINEIFFLQLHQLLVQNDMLKDQRGEMFFEALHEIYSCQVQVAPGKMVPAVLNIDGSIATPASVIPAQIGAPFRTCLSKMFLVLSMVNSAEPLYQRRKETILLHLNEILLEMIAINRSLDVARQLNEDRIRRFVTLVGIYHVKQPLMQAKTARNIAISLTLLTIIAIVLWIYREEVKRTVIDPGAKMASDGWESFKTKCEGLVASLVRIFQDEMMKPRPKTDFIAPSPDETTFIGYMAEKGLEAGVIKISEPRPARPPLAPGQTTLLDDAGDAATRPGIENLRKKLHGAKINKPSAVQLQWVVELPEQQPPAAAAAVAQ